jgi:salicylate hydroxylase
MVILTSGAREERAVARGVSVAIVGAGIGGLTAALALLRAGFDVHVYEQAARVSAAGAGLQLAPNSTRVLRGLGLLAEVERVSVRPTTFEFRRWDDDRVLSATPLGDSIEQTYGAPYLNAHRADFVALLAAAVPVDRVHTGRRCRSVEDRDDRAEIRFADGSTVTADLVVGADGIHSVVRHGLFGAEEPRFTGHVAYRGLVPADRAPRLSPDPRCTVRMGPGGHVVHYYVAAGRLLNVVCIAEERSWTRESWTDPGDVEELRALFAGWHPTVIDIIAAIDAPMKWALFDRDPFPRWSGRAVTLLGDACHPMLPYGAQGAAQAIEDAAVLAAVLAAADGPGVPGALARYETVRRERAARVQAISRGNAVRFHLPDGPDQQARDAAMASSFGLSPDIDWLYGTDPGS